MRISIITINYNNFEGLKKTVESVINQTYGNIEYIVIDGSSTDGSAEYIKQMSPYFHYWVSEPDNGIYGAMNKGIAKATGDYVLFLNSGDAFFESDTLKKVNSYLRHRQNIDVLHGKAIFNDVEQTFSQEVGTNIFSVSSLLVNALAHQSTYYKVDSFKKVGLYDESYRVLGDHEWNTRALMKCNLLFHKLDYHCSICTYGGVSENLSLRELEWSRMTLSHFTYVNFVIAWVRNYAKYAVRRNYFVLGFLNRLGKAWVKQFLNLDNRTRTI